MGVPVVTASDLHFRYRSGGREVLTGIELGVERGARALVIGANGAGKTTLLRVLAGKHMIVPDCVRVLGSSAFHDTSLASRIELLGGRFPFEVDLTVTEILARQVDIDPARVSRLIDVLGVDVHWHMHEVSDGQRRRVQLLLGLMRPREVLFLDEITTDLDLVARLDLLAFLHEESAQRGTTILYATHIFDTLQSWATEVVYLVDGKVALAAPIGDIAELAERPLVRVVEGWLRRDLLPLARSA